MAVVAATASPLFVAAHRDSYPLSTYPMFARKLDKPRLTFAEGVIKGGPAVRLPPALIANDEPMQALKTLRTAGNTGGRMLAQLCRSIATRVAAAPDYREVRRVRIARARFDPLTYFEAGPVAEEREHLASCRVRRTR